MVISNNNRFGQFPSANRSYHLTEEQISHITGKSEEEKVQEQVAETQPKTKRRDIYAEMPIRALGYTNELGEAIRPLSGMAANLSWLPAIAYISADIADKYKQDEYGNQEISKERASKQLVTQLLASVLLPTAAVKAGQAIVNGASTLTKVGLSLNNREKISDVVLDSMNRGEHKNYLDETGKVDKEAYKQALSEKLGEITKHKKTHHKESFISKVIDYIKYPFSQKAPAEKVQAYTGEIVDRLVDARQQLLDGVKPENLSNRGFKKFTKAAKDVSTAEKQSVAFDTIRKMEKSRMFNNRILKSIGGLMALAIMAKPIDRFVENVIIDKYVGPTIDKVGDKLYNYKQGQG